MNTQTTPNKNPHEAKFELSRLRLIARLCVAVACFIQFLGRIVIINVIIDDHSPDIALRLLTLPFAPTVTLIVLFEYLLFRKLGSRILKYSQVFDIIILLVFTADWILGLVYYFLKTVHTDPALFSFSTTYAVTGMAWKTLLVTLMVQKWQLKILAPTAVTIVSTVFAIHYNPNVAYIYLVRCATQLFNVIFIIICEDKIKWKMIWANLQQEKWVQVNNFILNNIPENIMILDIKGEAKFVSDYCKNFMAKCFHQDPKEFFNKIKDLQQQNQFDCESPMNHPTSFALKVDRLTTANELLMTETTSTRVDVLTDLITNFQEIIKEKNLEEKQFLIYNGKLKTENQDKSIEVKVSFIQHFECEYIILILRDTTKRDLLLTLEKTNKYKDQLLASVSHELRAPLNGNINLVESAITSPQIPEALKEKLLVPALRSSKFLLHIINDIIDMSQIKQKKLRLAFQTGDLKETLKSTAQLIELQAKKKGIDLALELDPKLPQNFFTDHMRLSQIVLNLLSNAMKFTKEGVIKLIATPVNNTSWVKVTVEDSGIGMSQEDMNRLFSSYTHIEFEGRQAMNPAGVGLGLNISSNLVELLAPKDHPNINVRSIPNKGSSFSFILENKEDCPIITHSEEEEEGDSNNSNRSVQIAEELPETIQPVFYSKLHTFETSNSDTELSEISCGCPRILIVDDNPFNVMAFETILSSFNIKCDSVYCGSSAIKKLQNRGTQRCGKDCKAYSVIFMDQEMPGMNGSETVREIRRLEREGTVPEMRIIGCTAHQAKEEVDRFLESGLDKCISKPISTQLIKSLL